MGRPKKVVDYDRETVIAELTEISERNGMGTEINLSDHIIAIYLVRMFEELKELSWSIGKYNEENR